MALPAHGARTLWVAVAGSERSASDARGQLQAAFKDPAAELAAKIASRRAINADTQVSLPGDRLLQNAITWGKQNLADLTQTASDLQIRWTNQGTQYPAPLGTVAHAQWFAAGYPDYPWLFATDGEYTAFAAVGVGQFSTIEDHMLALRDVSRILNGSSGIVAHETTTTGAVYFGQNSVNSSSGETSTNNFNTDETVKLPSAVALIWRWTGDNAFMRQMYGFARDGMHTIARQWSQDPAGWPTGSGNVEVTGMGPEKLDNAVYFIRGLYDLADMARFAHDSATPGVAAHAHALTALRRRESACFSGTRPGNLGLFHTGCGGGADGKGDVYIFSLPTGVMAVALGNCGLFGAGQQQRYADANAETMFSEPATGGTLDEQPGAMPEIFPSSPNGDPSQGVPANINRCWTCRSQVMQAWATTARYGRWCISSWASARSSPMASSMSCRRSPPASRASPAPTSGSGPSRPTYSRPTPAGATRPRSPSGGCRCTSC